MTPLEQQFEVLKSYHKETSLLSLRDGSYLVSIPQIQLPNGWTKSSTEVKFIAPVGYPLARPDCFWADSDLRVGDENMPQSANIGSIPNYDVTSSYLWFSWHLASWNPNNDNLITYLNVIKRRLHDPR